MNKDLINDEMSKKLESEYKNLILQDVPDLWSRIEAGLEPKQQDLRKSSNEKKIVSFRKKYKTWGTIAVACACVAIALPVFVNSINNKNEISASDMVVNEDTVAEMAADSADSAFMAEQEGNISKNPDMDGFSFDESISGLESAITTNDAANATVGDMNEQSEYKVTISILDRTISDKEIIYTAKVIISDSNSILVPDDEIVIYEYISQNDDEKNNSMEAFGEYEVTISPETNDLGEQIYNLISFQE